MWWPHQGRTLSVERSPISALVTKLAFSISIGWQPIVPPPLGMSMLMDSMVFCAPFSYEIFDRKLFVKEIFCVRLRKFLKGIFFGGGEGR